MATNRCTAPPRIPPLLTGDYPLLRLILLLACGLLPLTAHAENARYRLDPVHTRVLFAIEHAGFSQALGTVSGSEGVLEFDPTDWSTAQLDVVVPITRLDLGNDKWNQATLARNLLDGERFPQAHFVSSRVEPIDEHHARLFGQLTLRGVTREVALDVTLNALKRYPLPPFRRTAGFSATATLSRAEFGITAWNSVIGDRVELRIEAEAVRDESAEAPLITPEAAPTPPDETLQNAADAALKRETETHP
ncbi:YceI family protein [Stenotrophomonas sp. SY1]|uniref:YceI family protein n=1 Tax=Stenotrophomonas sp. SY1 TaxID=477235 RepID=UPI001E587D64|nr:YceI family protein [Stenotrophomonas sp. SY1]MCD9086309.1 YceI family protein [Stenotrophomonas sp. SY1]